MAERIADVTLWNYTGRTYCISILWNFLESYLPEVARNIYSLQGTGNMLSRMFQILALYSVGKAETASPENIWHQRQTSFFLKFLSKPF